LRAAVFGGVALALGACAGPRDPMVEGRTGVTSGPWQIERAVDQVTQAPVSSAFVLTRTVSNSYVAFPPPAGLQLSCFKGEPIVRFKFPFKIGSTRNAQLGYVFDKNPGREPDARFIEGQKNVVIEDTGEVARFTDELANAKTLYIRIRSLNAGRTSAEFQVDGAPAAIAAAYAGCPIVRDPRAKKPKVARARAAAESEPEDDDAPALNSLTGIDTARQTEEEAAIRQIMGWFGR
jgi:hypothetical protein